MIEQIERFPRVRDRAIFVGEPGDVVDRDFGPGLPRIRPWTEAHFDFSGYITDFDPRELQGREMLREQLGYGEDERVCVVAVGGSGVGGALLGRLAASFEEAREMVPDLRMILVAGPNVDTGTLPLAERLEVRPYVPDLHLHLAASDLAAVQGGLATTMELTAAQRPFLYFPLKHHFEQQVHVRHRLERYRSGACVQFDDAAPELLATVIAEQIGRQVRYERVTGDGAARAARLISELI
jgi:predicted glycosyltransferase